MHSRILYLNGKQTCDGTLGTIEPDEGALREPRLRGTGAIGFIDAVLVVSSVNRLGACRPCSVIFSLNFSR